MTKPIISFFISSIRTNCWMNLYNSLKGNKVPFEIIFCGDVKPDFKIPKNIKFIYSETKPSQCFHIAHSYADGDIVAMVADDCVFSKGSIDNIDKKFNKIGYDNNILLNLLDINTKGKIYHEQLHFLASGTEKKDYNPMVGSGFFMSKKTWKDIGGIDNRFLALYWDLDIMMRAHYKKINVSICSRARATEIRPQGRRSSILSREYASTDVILAYSLWCVRRKNPHKRYDFCNNIVKTRKELKQMVKKGEILLLNDRSISVSPFENRDDLLIKSQGTTGKWV